jgi:phosphohistidine phosphatase
MHLLVIRHGIAEERVPNEDDATRQLTRTGERRIRSVARGLRALGWKLDCILTSPWLRAARTAELLEKLGKTESIQTELLARSPTAELLALVSESASAKRNHATAVVGHEPWLGELVGWLAFGDGRFGEGIGFKKGTVAWLEGNAAPGGMTLRGIFPPNVLREL